MKEEWWTKWTAWILEDPQVTGVALNGWYTQVVFRKVSGVSDL